MKLIKAIFILCVLSLVLAPVVADELGDRIEKIMSVGVDADYAEYLAAECTSCHQTEANKGTPVIAGMSKQRIIISLLLYQNGSRINPTMESISSVLGDEEIASLAEYFSTLFDSQVVPIPGD